MYYSFSMRFGTFDLDIDCQRFVRIIHRALLVRREHSSALTLAQVSTVVRRIQFALDVLTLRLQARAPLTPRGRLPRRLPRQTPIFLYFREQFPPLLQGIDQRSRPSQSADLDAFINSTIAGWYHRAIAIMTA